jgi:hypothetical protein
MPWIALGHWLRPLALASVVGVGLAACGDAEETAGTQNSTTSTNGTVVSIALERTSDGAATSTISSGAPGTLTVIIRKSDGSRPAGALVTFTTTLGVLSPAAGTALSNSEGEATIQLLAGNAAGAGTVTAVAKVGTESITVGLNFEVADTSVNGYDLALTLVDPNGAATSSVSADAPGTLSATVTDGDGDPVSGAIVVFETSIGLLNPANGAAITNASGVASVTLTYDAELGADTVTATATANSETLTTGLNYQVAPPSIRLGSTSGTFAQGALLVGASPLSAGASTTVTANIVTSAGAAFTTPVNVSFASLCAAAGTSTIDATVAAINGQAVATYQAAGCIGTDTITASVEFGGSTFSATGSVAVTADTVGSVAFVSASPTLIAIKGTGGAGLSETSTVTFRVLGTLGSPIANQPVTFTLNTDVGGIALTSASGYTNGAGNVSTVVQAGAVATSARVTASVAVGATVISAQSDQLAISTGIPDQNSTSISVETLNPEAFNIDGVEVDVTARLADQFNNPVPNGTTVYFTAEGGAIESQCQTSNGACTVTWRSQNPRPVDHRVTLLITAVGNESFHDEDGNGSYSDGDGEPYGDVNANGVLDEPFTDANANSVFDEPFVDGNANVSYDFGETYVDYNDNGRYDGAGNNPAGETVFVDRNGNGVYDGAGVDPAGESYTDADGGGDFDPPGFADLPEAFLDMNENGARDNGEAYWDFNANGQYTARDGQYSGVLCTHATLCAAKRTVHVRDSAVLIMSGSAAHIVAQNAANIAQVYGSNKPNVSANTALNVAGGSATLNIHVSDIAGQVMPEGSTIAVSAEVGELSGATSYVVPSTNIPGSVITVVIADDDTNANDSGALTIVVTTPGGVITTLTIALQT